MKAPCYQHDSYDSGCSSCREMNQPKAMNETRKGSDWIARRNEAVGVADMLWELRELGWRVACHNDYMQNGELHTFWLFTYGVWCAKGEAKTDYEALRIVRHNIAKLKMDYGS